VTGAGVPPRTHAPLSSRTSPRPQGSGGVFFFSVFVTHCRRSFGLTGVGQHAPLDVRFADAQHLPSPVGTKPEAQHTDIFGSLWRG
jgi:hypothetical protein